MMGRGRCNTLQFGDSCNEEQGSSSFSKEKNQKDFFDSRPGALATSSP
jgi:hypothetical protein